jgi:hypothetical protein
MDNQFELKHKYITETKTPRRAVRKDIDSPLRTPRLGGSFPSGMKAFGNQAEMLTTDL